MDFDTMLFQEWRAIVRTAFVGVLAYIGLVAILRVSGKRTLSKLNAFDLVVTVALGSTLAAILLQENVALAEGLTAFGLLILLQWAVAFSSVRSQLFARAVRSEPTLLVSKGQLCHDAMRRERVTKEEAESAVRASGGMGLEDVHALILESDGTMSVILGR